MHVGGAFTAVVTDKRPKASITYVGACVIELDGTRDAVNLGFEAPPWRSQDQTSQHGIKR